MEQIIQELKEVIEEYINFYNHRKPQGRYNDQTPMEVRKEALSTTEEVNQYPICENKQIKNYDQSFKSKQTDLIIV